MPQGRALAWGLIAAGVAIAFLILVWMLINFLGRGLAGGGFVLGLIILVVLAGPPLGVGLYLLSRGKQEEAEGQVFDRQRRMLDSDRLLRREMARDFRQQADRLAAHSAPTAARLRDLAEDLEKPGYDQASWYDTVDVDQEAQDQLRQYDDLLVEEQRRVESAVRNVENGGPNAEGALGRVLDRWEEQFRRRQDLLLRGRKAPSLSATEVLRSREPTRGAQALAALKHGDAVSYEDQDYVVEASATYFSSGRTWAIHTLRSEGDERSLYVGPAGATLALLEPAPPPATANAPSFSTSSGDCPLEESGSATVTVVGAVGRGEGVLVDYWRYACPDSRLVWVEQFPADTPRAFTGSPLNPAAFEVWPAA